MNTFKSDQKVMKKKVKAIQGCKAAFRSYGAQVLLRPTAFKEQHGSVKLVWVKNMLAQFFSTFLDKSYSSSRAWTLTMSQPTKI